jgi:plastocyanin
MNGTTLFLIILIILIIVGVGIYLISTGNNNSPAPVTDTTNQQQTSQPPPNLTSAISIANFAFSPATLTVKVGTTVVWTNNDSVGHQIKSNTNAFGSNILNSGDRYQFTFNNAGTFGYICSIHPSMKGTIIVTQ